MRIDHNLGELAEDLIKMAAAYDVNVRQAVRDVTAEIQTQVRANASTHTHRTTEAKRYAPHVSKQDPDGPNVRTGDYRRSIQASHGSEGGVPVGYIFTNAAQARRLEYGFVGEDSKGRKYKQPPYPHWGPAADKAEGRLEQAILDGIDRAITRGGPAD